MFSFAFGLKSRQLRRFGGVGLGLGGWCLLLVQQQKDEELEPLRREGTQATAAKKAAAQSNSEEIQKMLALQKQEQVMLQKLNAQQKSLMAKAKNPKLNKEAKTQILKTLVKLNKIIKLKMGTMKASMEAVSAAGSTVTRKQPATLSVAKVSTTKLAAVESDSDTSTKQDDTQEAAVAEVAEWA